MANIHGLSGLQSTKIRDKFGGFPVSLGKFFLIKMRIELNAKFKQQS